MNYISSDLVHNFNYCPKIVGKGRMVRSVLKNATVTVQMMEIVINQLDIAEHHTAK
jgi:hypothetical protein